MRIDNTIEKTVDLKHPIKIGKEEFKSLVIREVVGFDEEAISQPQFKKNPVLMLHTLLSRCIVEVPGAERVPTIEEIKNLPVGAVDSLVLDLRELTMGTDIIEYTAFCKNKECKKPNEGNISAKELKSNSDYNERIIELKRGIFIENKKYLKVKIKPVDGNIQSIFIRKKEQEMDKFGEVSTEFLLACIVDIEGVKPTSELVSSMSRLDRKIVSDAIKDLEGPSGIITIECEYCGEEIKHNLNLLDFLA